MSSKYGFLRFAMAAEKTFPPGNEPGPGGLLRGKNERKGAAGVDRKSRTLESKHGKMVVRCQSRIYWFSGENVDLTH